MKEKSVTRWFVMAADGCLVDGPYKHKRGAKVAMIKQPGYRKYRDWYSLAQQSYRIPCGNVGGMRAVGRGQNGWKRERDLLKAEAGL